jgi:O-antigen/teichoic acid export membrane protein
MTQMVSQARTKNYVRQVKGSVIFKGLAVAASFMVIPLMIRYLGREQYGVWSTLLSIMSWVSFFDLGIGNGLRNKLAEALAKNQTVEAAAYVSSGYSWIGVVSMLLFILISAITFYIPWQHIFNTQEVENDVLRNAVLAATFFVLINFWMGLINQVLNAVQKTSLTVLGQLISNTTGLFLVFLLSKTTNSSLFFLIAAYGGSITVANFILSYWFYAERRDLIPKLFFNRQHIHPLISVGFQFFMIQVAVLVIFTTDKILIAQLFGPIYVAEYDVVFKLFGIITMIHGLINSPLWSSYTDAYHRKDFSWIEALLKRQMIIFSAFAVATVLMVISAKSIIYYWIGGEMTVSFEIIVIMGLFVVESCWLNIFAICLNGIQKLELSYKISAFAMLANIPISILLAKHTSFGSASVLLGAICALMPGVILGPLQLLKIINRKDTGIWSR